MKQLITTIIGLFLLTACVSQVTYLPVKPEVSVAANNIGHNKKLGFTVSDQRDTSNKAPIQTGDNIVNNIAASINQLITSNGFTPAGYNQNNTRNLKVDLLAVDGGVVTVNKKQSYEIHVAIMADATNNGQRYRYIYRGAGTTPAKLIGKYQKQDMTKDINVAFANALNAMGSDKKLWGFLAKS